MMLALILAQAINMAVTVTECRIVPITNPGAWAAEIEICTTRPLYPTPIDPPPPNIG